MHTYKLPSGLVVTSMSWKEYQEKKSAKSLRNYEENHAIDAFNYAVITMFPTKIKALSIGIDYAKK